MDIGVNEHLAANVQLLQQQLPEIDAFGLVLHTDTAGVSQINGLQAPCFISQVPVERYVQLTGLHNGAFITRWQDAGERDYLTFDGLLDHWGRYKPSYYQLAEKWSSYAYKATAFPQLHILRPAKLTKKDEPLTYRAIVNNGHGWTLKVQPSLQYEWHLVKTDAWGNAVYMKKLGRGPEITVRIPEEAAMYSLYLTASKGKDVIGTLSPLNIPL
jgi:hypothetical protein